MPSTGASSSGRAGAVDARRFRVRARDKESAVAHFERLADRYAEHASRFVWRWLRGRERAAVLAAAELASARSLIDVGCGSGFYALAAKTAGLHVWATDLAPRMVARIAAQVDRALVGDVESLRIARRFDVVVCAGVLDFVVDPRRALGNVLALVDVGGRAVLLVPRVGLGGLWYRIESLGARLRVNLFEVSWIARVAAECGMNIDRVEEPFLHNVVVRVRRGA